MQQQQSPEELSILQVSNILLCNAVVLCRSFGAHGNIVMLFGYLVSGFISFHFEDNMMMLVLLIHFSMNTRMLTTQKARSHTE